MEQGREHLHSSHLKFEVSSVKRASSLGSGIDLLGKNPETPGIRGSSDFFFTATERRSDSRVQDKPQRVVFSFFLTHSILQSGSLESTLDSLYSNKLSV